MLVKTAIDYNNHDRVTPQVYLPRPVYVGTSGYYKIKVLLYCKGLADSEL